MQTGLLAWCIQTRNKGDIAAIPVAANLPAMEHLTYETYLADPSAAYAQIQRAAGRARAEALYRHVLEPLARFCGRLTAIRGVRMQLDPRIQT